MSKKKENIEPVYFMDLVVENVRCFKDRQVMDLSDGNGKPAQWTIILGDNGTGKTTLLKCLALLQPREGLTRVNENKYKQSIFPKGAEFLHLYDDFKFKNQSKNVLKISNHSFYKGRLNAKGKLSKGYNIEQNSKGHVSYTEIAFKSNIFTVAYNAERKVGKASLSECLEENSTLKFLSGEVKILNAEAWLLETDFAIKSSKGNIKKHLQSHYIKVKETLKKLLPDVHDFRIKEITKTNIQAAIEVKTPYGWVDMKNLSLGYQTFIAWVVDLAARLFDRYPDSESPLEEPCIVLVDEIDLHLHPKWQRKIIGFLSDIFKNAQFIVTAHSPLIVQAAEGANIVLLKREGDSVKIYNDVEKDSIQDWTIDQILTSDLYNLITSRPPKFDPILERKQDILKKRKLTKTDKIELESISKKLDNLPLKNEATSEAIDALKKAAAILKS